MKTLVLTSALALTAACRTTETHSPAGAATPVVRLGTRARTWEVRCGDELVGLVVLFQERGLARDSIYLVRNTWNQDLGLIDGHGRAYRYLPHHDDPAWVGSGTIAGGVERILGSHGPCALLEQRDPSASSGSGSMEASALRDDADDAPQPAEAPISPASDAPPPDEGLPQSR
jgi:hypothetical protein